MFQAPFRLGSITRNWLGESQYNDVTFNGLVDEFRVYRGALGAAQIASLIAS
ncbi:LamG-like jellyroll fold domain-containing protein [Burkholderia sp. BE17]|uniref:LamG-like jellyroll fold domain-containing protein n=1 Tax=Burkholderia sp. BE17 TaxID=2656644 RepID=UPI002AB04F47|nr:LamG-like jellyroll fold domain-containing protein [Burkholderia sp. BE17]